MSTPTEEARLRQEHPILSRVEIGGGNLVVAISPQSRAEGSPAPRAAGFLHDNKKPRRVWGYTGALFSGIDLASADS